MSITPKPKNSNGRNLFGQTKDITESAGHSTATKRPGRSESTAYENLITSSLSTFRAEVKDGFNQCTDALSYILDRIERVESEVKQLEEKSATTSKAKAQDSSNHSCKLSKSSKQVSFIFKSEVRKMYKELCEDKENQFEGF